MGGERLEEYLILAEKPCEWWEPGDGEYSDQEGHRGDLHAPVQAAHLLHVYLAVQGVHHASRTQEHERLEEGVGHQVEDPGGKGPDSGGQEHVAELADGGVGENTL